MKQIIKKYCALLIALAMVLPVMSVRAFAETETSTNVGPVVEKTVTDNGNGSHKIKLELTGKVNTTQEVTKANVLVVLDLSGSMNNETGGRRSSTRLAAAKEAVNSVAETLLGLNTEKNPDLVEMGLITFSNKAETEKFGDPYSQKTKTTSLTQFKNKVTSLSAEGGTNWEDALDAANNFKFNDNDKTYVIFVSDGNPTYRNTRINSALLPRSDNKHWDHDYYDYYGNGDYYYNQYKNDDPKFRSDGIYGLGADTPSNLNYSLTSMKRCYQAALSAAKEVVKEKDLYGIGIYGNAAWVNNLINESGAGNDHYFAANDTAALNESLKNIANIITTSLKQHDVKVTDGVTSLSTISANVDGKPEGFVYKKNDVVWPKAPDAQIVDGKVVWDLSSVGGLEDGVKYSVEFNVWPSQDAFDLVADLNNGKTPDNSYADYKNQLTKKDDDTGTYLLKTNTDLKTNFTYKDENKEEEFDPGNNTMEVQSSKISLVKLWDENKVDDRGNEQITLILKKDGEDYLTKVLNDETHFKADNIYVAPGIIINGKVLEKGHDYSVTESGDNAYHWELNADTYHPMLINGQLTMLKKDDSGTYTIDGKNYSAVGDNATIKATNSRRSYLNFTKKVTEAQANTASKDDLFSYNVTINAADNKEVWFAVKDESGNYVTNLETTATKDANDGNYYKVESGKQFTVKLKRDWNFRAINLLSNSTYSIEETDIPDGYLFENYKINEGNINVEGNKVTGTIEAANKAYTLTNTNKYNGYFYVYHSSNNQVEKVSITDSRVVNGKFDLTKEVSNGYLYGGYFKAYGQTTSTNDQIKDLTYTDGKATDPNGTEYTGAKFSAWKATNACHENGQTEFKPQVDKVYYLKEVPNDYFKPRMVAIYDKIKETHPVTDLYLFTAVDDANYKSVSLNNENNTKLYVRAAIKNNDGSVNKYLTVKGEFKSLPRGYIALHNVKDKVKSQDIFEFTPTYVTLDGVKLSGVVKRRVDFGDGRFNPDPKTGESVAPGLHHIDN